MKVYRPTRCALCQRMLSHPIHNVSAPPSWWRRLLHLMWPRWMWGYPDGGHLFVSKAIRVEMAEEMFKLKQRKGRI